MYKNFFKRISDFLIALTGLIILSPLFLVLIIWLHFANKFSGVFFIQQRPGKNGKIFNLIKFKTMTDEQDTEGRLLPDNNRLTKIGKLLRSGSIDEIPQLINIIKGEMSFIGPRPLLIEYLELYSENQKKRHFVRPGITGWAQVNGRNTITWQKKFEYDVWYVDNQSFILDVRILLLTIHKVFMSQDVNFSDTVTMQKFTGNN